MVTCNDCIHRCVCPIADGCEYADEQHIRDDCEYFAYTADVVPKSEVEELQSEIEELQAKVEKLRNENIELLVSEETDIYISMEKLVKVRTEHPIFKAIEEKVSREFFEEIEEYAELQIESLNIAEKLDSSGADFFGGGKQAFALLLDHLAELKKKYTEDNKS